MLDRKILVAMYHAERPIGLETLSVVSGEARRTLETTVEPYLMKQGLMLRTPSGRIITEKGIDYLNRRGYIQSKSLGRVIKEE